MQYVAAARVTEYELVRDALATIAITHAQQSPRSSSFALGAFLPRLRDAHSLHPDVY